MNNQTAFHKYCKQFISQFEQGNLFDALQTLGEMGKLIPDGDFQDLILLFKSRLARLDRSRGELGYQEESRERTVLSNQVLGVYKDMRRAATEREQLSRFKDKIEVNTGKIDQLSQDVAALSTKLTFKADLAKERYQRLGECWSAMYRFERYFYKQLQQFLLSILEAEHKYLVQITDVGIPLPELVLSQEVQDRMDGLTLRDSEHQLWEKTFDAVFEEYDKVDLVLEENRFWLGPTFYGNARTCLDCYLPFFQSFKDRHYLGCVSCLKEHLVRRETIDGTVAQIQKEWLSVDEWANVRPENTQTT